MPYLLGIEIGETTVAAALCRRSGPSRGRAPHASAEAAWGASKADPATWGLGGAGRGEGEGLWNAGENQAGWNAGEAAWGPAEAVPLGSSAPVIPCSLVLSPSGELVSGEGAARSADQASGFLHRLGDGVGIRLAGRMLRSEVMLAGMVGWVAGRLWQLEGGAPDRIAVAHPTGWGPYRLRLLRTALDEAGLGEPALVPRAGAVVTAVQAAGRLPAGAAVLMVFRLDDAGLEVSLMVPHATGQYELVTSAWCTDLNGSDVEASGSAGQRSVLRAAVDFAARTVAACGLPPAELSAVLLAGSATGHAVLTDLLAQALRVPVVRLGDPRLSVACGAALSVRPRSRGGRQGPVPMVPESPTAEAPLVTAMEPLPPGPVGALPPPRPPVRVTEAPVGRR